MPSPTFLGLDFGTSGARACVIAPNGEIEDMARVEFGALSLGEAALTWREALLHLIAQVPAGLRKQLGAISVNGTSATVLACDAEFNLVYSPLMYNDARAVDEAKIIARAAGAEHPAAMATSGLAKVLWLKNRLGAKPASVYLNQADWLSALLSGRPVSDFHNALKMGMAFGFGKSSSGKPTAGQTNAEKPDAQAGQWPQWVGALAGLKRLPALVKPGADVGLLARSRALELGINTDCLIRAGTTDSIAAFLAAGVNQPGEAVTSLGTTLVLKLLSRKRVDAAQFGVYSHWFGDMWLTGGASNAGGGVLRQHFADDELAALSARINPAFDTGLNYLPLPCPGERFPINDPTLQPRLTPKPESRVEFLQGILEGLAQIEATGYGKLAELGATPLSCVISTGGGAKNGAYTRIRERKLQVPVALAAQHEACYGTARLACFGPQLFTLASGNALR